MNKPQAIALTTTELVTAVWFSYWLTLTLSSSSYLAVVAALMSIPVSLIPVRGVLELSHDLKVIERYFHPYKHLLSFAEYRAVLGLFEFATLWNVGLVGGQILIYLYVYELIPVLTPLYPYGLEKLVVLLFTVIAGSILVFLFTKILGYILTNKAVKDFDKKGDLQVISTVDNEIKQAGGNFKPKRQTCSIPSALLFILSIPIGFYVNHIFGAALALIAVHALTGVELPVPWLHRWQIYGGLVPVGLGMALTLNGATLTPALALSLAGILTLATVAVYAYPDTQYVMPRYKRLVRGLLWGIAGAYWVSFSLRYPALLCLMFSFANLISLFSLLAGGKKNERIA